MTVVRNRGGNNVNTSLRPGTWWMLNNTLITSFPYWINPTPSSPTLFYFLGLGLGQVSLSVTRRVEKFIGFL